MKIRSENKPIISLKHNNIMMTNIYINIRTHLIEIGLMMIQPIVILHTTYPVTFATFDGDKFLKPFKTHKYVNIPYR